MKQFLLWGAMLLAAVAGITLYAERAEACASHPCILFTEQDLPAIEARAVPPLSLPLTQQTTPQKAFSAFRSNCVAPTSAVPNALYQECAMRYLLTGQGDSGKTAFMADINAPVPASGGAPYVSYLSALKIPRMVLTFDWLKAAGQITPAEEAVIIHRLQEWAQGIKNYSFGTAGNPNPSVPHTINAYVAAVNNATYSFASAMVLIATILEDNPHALTGTYFNTPAAIEALRVQGRNLIYNGNRATFSVGGIYPEGFRYPDYGVTTGGIYAARALAINHEENEFEFLGNVRAFAGKWILYTATGGFFPYYAETQSQDGGGQRLSFELYRVIGLLWQNGEQELARFAKSRFDDLYNAFYPTATNNNYNNLFYGWQNGNSAQIATMLWWPETIPSGFNANVLRPSQFFQNNADSGSRNTQNPNPGQSGELVVNNRLQPEVVAGGDRFVKLLHSTIGRWANHQGPFDGQIIVSMKDSAGIQRFLEGAGYIQQSNWVGANTTDYNVPHRVGEIRSGNHFNWRLNDGTTKAMLSGWDNVYYRATHNAAWLMSTEGSRTLAFVNDPTLPYAIVFDYLNDANVAASYEEVFNSEVPASSSGNSLMMTGGGKQLAMKFHQPASGLSFTTPTTATQIATNHTAYRNTVRQTTTASNPNAKFLSTMKFLFPGVTAPTETTLAVSGGYGFKMVHPNGETDFGFVRNPEAPLMSYTAGDITLAATDARFVWVKKDATGVKRFIIGEGRTVTVDGTALLNVTTPGVTVNASVGKGVEISRTDPFASNAVPLPQVSLFAPNAAILATPSSSSEVRWNEEVLASSQYTLAGTNLFVNMPLPITCTVQGLSWQAPLVVPGGAVGTVNGTTTGCANGTDIQLQVKEYDDPGSALQPTSFPTVNVSVTNNQFSHKFHAVWGPYDGPTEGVEYRVTATPPSGPSFTSSNSLDVSKSPHTLTVPPNVYATQVGTVTVSTTAPGSYKVYLFTTGVAPYEDPVILSNGPVQVPVYWDISDLGTTWAEIGNGTMSAATPYIPSFSIPANAPPQYYLIALIEDLSTNTLIVPTLPIAVSVVGGTGSVAILFSPLSGAIVLILLGILLIVLLFMRFHEKRRR